MSRAWKPQVSDDLGLDIWLMYNVPVDKLTLKQFFFQVYNFFFYYYYYKQSDC